MATLVTAGCQVRGKLLVCGSGSQAFCQYCGRPFCDRHGVVLSDGQEICSRKECVAKREDLDRHLLYKVTVYSRNTSGECGLEACHTKPAAQCCRCAGNFCLLHVFEREDIVMRNRVRVVVMAALCRHCHTRRPIWLRT